MKSIEANPEVEHYKNGMLMEFFLEGVLRLSPQQAHSLKGLYENLLRYEEGGGPWLTPAYYRKGLDKFRRYFERAINRLTTTGNIDTARRLKKLNYEAKTSADLLAVFKGLREMREGGK